jgi:hypothetical protein
MCIYIPKHKELENMEMIKKISYLDESTSETVTFAIKGPSDDGKIYLEAACGNGNTSKFMNFLIPAVSAKDLAGAILGAVHRSGVPIVAV